MLSMSASASTKRCPARWLFGVLMVAGYWKVARFDHAISCMLFLSFDFGHSYADCARMLSLTHKTSFQDSSCVSTEIHSKHPVLDNDSTVACTSSGNRRSPLDHTPPAKAIGADCGEARACHARHLIDHLPRILCCWLPSTSPKGDHNRAQFRTAFVPSNGSALRLPLLHHWSLPCRLINHRHAVKAMVHQWGQGMELRQDWLHLLFRGPWGIIRTSKMSRSIYNSASKLKLPIHRLLRDFA